MQARREAVLAAAAAAEDHRPGRLADALATRIDVLQSEAGDKGCLSRVLLEAGRPARAGARLEDGAERAAHALDALPHSRTPACMLAGALVHSSPDAGKRGDAARAEALAEEAAALLPADVEAAWAVATARRRLFEQGRADAADVLAAFRRAVRAAGAEGRCPASLLLEQGVFLRSEARDLAAARRALEAAVRAASPGGDAWRELSEGALAGGQGEPLACVLGQALAQLAMLGHQASGASGLSASDAAELYSKSLA